MLATPPSAAGRFALIVEALCRIIAARGRAPNWAANWGPGGGAPLLPVPLSILIWTRLSRMAVRFAALAAQIHAGTLRSPNKARVHRAPRGEDRRNHLESRGPQNPNRPTSPRLPTAFGWLIRLAPQAVCYTGQLRHLLSDPEMAPLLSAPQTARILRSLCRMLGVQFPKSGPPTHAPQPHSPRSLDTPPSRHLFRLPSRHQHLQRPAFPAARPVETRAHPGLQPSCAGLAPRRRRVPITLRNRNLTPYTPPTPPPLEAGADRGSSGLRPAPQLRTDSSNPIPYQSP